MRLRSLLLTQADGLNDESSTQAIGTIAMSDATISVRCRPTEARSDRRGPMSRGALTGTGTAVPPTSELMSPHLALLAQRPPVDRGEDQQNGQDQHAVGRSERVVADALEGRPEG